MINYDIYDVIVKSLRNQADLMSHCKKKAIEQYQNLHVPDYMPGHVKRTAS